MSIAAAALATRFCRCPARAGMASRKNNSDPVGAPLVGALFGPNPGRRLERRLSSRPWEGRPSGRPVFFRRIVILKTGAWKDARPSRRVKHAAPDARPSRRVKHAAPDALPIRRRGRRRSSARDTRHSTRRCRAGDHTRVAPTLIQGTCAARSPRIPDRSSLRAIKRTPHESGRTGFESFLVAEAERIQSANAVRSHRVSPFFVPNPACSGSAGERTPGCGRARSDDRVREQ